MLNWIREKLGFGDEGTDFLTVQLVINGILYESKAPVLVIRGQYIVNGAGFVILN